MQNHLGTPSPAPEARGAGECHTQESKRHLAGVCQPEGHRVQPHVASTGQMAGAAASVSPPAAPGGTGRRPLRLVLKRFKTKTTIVSISAPPLPAPVIHTANNVASPATYMAGNHCTTSQLSSTSSNNVSQVTSESEGYSGGDSSSSLPSSSQARSSGSTRSASPESCHNYQFSSSSDTTDADHRSFSNASIDVQEAMKIICIPPNDIPEQDKVGFINSFPDHTRNLVHHSHTQDGSPHLDNPEGAHAPNSAFLAKALRVPTIYKPMTWASQPSFRMIIPNLAAARTSGSQQPSHPTLMSPSNEEPTKQPSTSPSSACSEDSDLPSVSSLSSPPPSDQSDAGVFSSSSLSSVPTDFAPSSPPVISKKQRKPREKDKKRSQKSSTRPLVLRKAPRPQNMSRKPKPQPSPLNTTVPLHTCRSTRRQPFEHPDLRLARVVRYLEATCSGTQARKGINRQRPALHRPEMYSHDNCDCCGTTGLLICCDRCPRAFHYYCADPPLYRENLPKKWICRVCQGTIAGDRRQHQKIKGSRNRFFGRLIDQLEFRNPTTFKLPESIRNRYRHVGTDPQSGSYVDTRRVRKGFPDRDFESLRSTTTGRYRICYMCSRSAIHGIKSIDCDFCSLSFHWDCLDPPLIHPPPNQKKWMCPLHVEHEMEHREKLKRDVLVPAQTIGGTNNGDIRVVLNGDTAEDVARDALAYSKRNDLWPPVITNLERLEKLTQPYRIATRPTDRLAKAFRISGSGERIRDHTAGAQVSPIHPSNPHMGRHNPSPNSIKEILLRDMSDTNTATSTSLSGASLSSLTESLFSASSSSISPLGSEASVKTESLEGCLQKHSAFGKDPVAFEDHRLGIEKAASLSCKKRRPVRPERCYPSKRTRSCAAQTPSPGEWEAPSDGKDVPLRQSKRSAASKAFAKESLGASPGVRQAGSSTRTHKGPQLSPIMLPATRTHPDLRECKSSHRTKELGKRRSRSTRQEAKLCSESLFVLAGQMELHQPDSQAPSHRLSGQRRVVNHQCSGTFAIHGGDDPSPLGQTTPRIKKEDVRLEDRNGYGSGSGVTLSALLLPQSAPLPDIVKKPSRSVVRGTGIKKEQEPGLQGAPEPRRSEAGYLEQHKTVLVPEWEVRGSFITRVKLSRLLRAAKVVEIGERNLRMLADAVAISEEEERVPPPGESEDSDCSLFNGETTSEEEVWMTGDSPSSSAKSEAGGSLLSGRPSRRGACVVAGSAAKIEDVCMAVESDLKARPDSSEPLISNQRTESIRPHQVETTTTTAPQSVHTLSRVLNLPLSPLATKSVSTPGPEHTRRVRHTQTRCVKLVNTQNKLPNGMGPYASTGKRRRRSPPPNPSTISRPRKMLRSSTLLSSPVNSSSVLGSESSQKQGAS